MSKWSKHELEDMLEDVVNELDLFEELPAQHGTNGTAPAEMVRSVLNQKDREISMLKQGFVDVNSPLSHPNKLDIEGIRERVKKDSVQIILDPEVAPVPPDGVVYFDFTVNLLAEIGRLRSELMAARKHMIQAAAECAREQGGMWESEEYPSSKAELRSKADSAARFVSNLAMWLKDKGARQ